MTGGLTVAALGWLAGLWLLWSVPRPRPRSSPPDMGGVSVVVPARDEEANLPRLLASLAGQQPPAAEVVVVDDHSSDRTAEVARAAGATVVPCPPLPIGWTGKCWACWAGAGVTAGTTLVFLDADTELAPGGLARVVAEGEERGGLVSVQPFHRTVRAYESLSAVFNIVPWMGIGAATPLGTRRSPAGAFGPCLVTSRADYLAVGGHQAVRGEVLEDVALARRYRRAGLPVTALGGKGTISFRMYGEGLGQLVEGWTKNFATGARATPPLLFVLVFAWIAGGTAAAWSGVTALAGAGTASAVAVGVAYAAYAAQLQWVLARLGRFAWWTAPLFPVPLAFFLAVFARSLALTSLRGEVRWRGRAVATKAKKPKRPS